ncbi:transcriptional regulator [Streptomyces longisporoflavus]|uniref:ArsR/SmtB family transcription factor n=1 Tax=Streptomyces longisporoflavus TaxID=28044 RepID=UPI00167DFFBF|nr:winged helix-turn-helix domain-containing protein [Streptomyces longisporoflavus]GGV67294.1 transcriptional regulator [Streptomyces longisporoflavus]
MTVRIHFTDEDLAQIRLAQTPDPMWESLLSMHMLQTQEAAILFRHWRNDVRRRLPTHTRELLRLAPPVGYSADFLTPAGGSGSLDAGIGALLSTSRLRLRKDLLTLSAGGGRLPAWTRPLADGDRDALAHVTSLFRTYFRTALSPWWESVRTRLEAERSAHNRYLAHGDLHGLLRGLHPGLVWHPPVLEVTGPDVDRDLFLNGRGLLVIPSFFCWRRPTLLKDPALPCAVVYPMTHAHALEAAPEGIDATHTAPSRALHSLIGKTRAKVLESIVDGGRTTMELAHDANISPATASHHAGVLRRAGLLSTYRVGKSVLHSLSPLGHALLQGRPCDERSMNDS